VVRLDRKTQPASASLRRHEWLEQPVLDGLRNAFALIGYLEHYSAAQEMFGLCRELVRRELRRLDPNFPARRRCLHRVEEEIEDRTMEQVIIANDDHWSRRKQLADRHAFRLVGVRGDERAGVTRDVDDVDPLHARHSRAREVEELRQQS